MKEIIGNRFKEIVRYIQTHYQKEGFEIDEQPEYDSMASYRMVVDVHRQLFEKEESFSYKINNWIIKKKLIESDVYKKVDMDRKLFSKIMTTPDYQPSKKTAILLCIALELGLDDTLDVLKSAGYTLSRSKKEEIAIEYFIVNGIFDIYEIKDALYELDLVYFD